MPRPADPHGRRLIEGEPPGIGRGRWRACARRPRLPVGGTVPARGGRSPNRASPAVAAGVAPRVTASIAGYVLLSPLLAPVLATRAERTVRPFGRRPSIVPTGGVR